MAHQPLEIEVVTRVTGSMNHCEHCQVFIDGVGVGDQVHQQDMRSYPADVMQDWERLSGWVLDLAEQFAGQLVIRITDAQTPRGLWKALTRGARRYPAFIVGGQETYQGWDRTQLEALIRHHLAATRAGERP